MRRRKEQNKKGTTRRDENEKNQKRENKKEKNTKRNMNTEQTERRSKEITPSKNQVTSRTYERHTDPTTLLIVTYLRTRWHCGRTKDPVLAEAHQNGPTKEDYATV